MKLHIEKLWTQFAHRSKGELGCSCTHSWAHATHLILHMQSFEKSCSHIFIQHSLGRPKGSLCFARQGTTTEVNEVRTWSSYSSPISDVVLGWHTVMDAISSLGTSPVQFMQWPWPISIFTPPPLLRHWGHHPSHIMGVVTSWEEQVCFRTCTKLQLFTFLHPAFEIQVGDSRRKKEADACIRPEQSCYPSVILEVGSSESLSQVEVDAQLWIEHVPEVRQSCLLLSPTHWNFFR